MVRHLEEVFFAPGVGSSLKEGVFAWIKGIGSKVSGSVLRDSWSLEERAGREPMREKDSGAKLNSTGRSLHLEKERAGREPR